MSRKMIAAAVVILVLVVVVAYVSLDIGSFTASLSRGQYSLVLSSHSINGTQVYTTWYNCLDNSVNLSVSGHVRDQWTNQTNSFDSGAVTIGPHKSVSVACTFSDYKINKITELELYAYDPQSYSTVYVPTYVYHP